MRFFLAVFFILVSCAQAPSQDINSKFKDENLNAAEWNQRWQTESREVYHARHDIFQAAALKPGQVIADLGTGPGAFLATMRNYVTETGKVFAVDISPNFIQFVRDRAQKNRWDNVATVLSEEKSTKLPPKSVDALFICDTYHHFTYYQDMLASMKQALKPAGKVILVDFERIPGKSKDWILSHVRAGKEQVIKEFQEAGFKLAREVKLTSLKENYLVLFAL